MPLTNYGLWKGMLNSLDPGVEFSKHMYIRFLDLNLDTNNGQHQEYYACINYRTWDQERARLVYWIQQNLRLTETNTIVNLPDGWNDMTSSVGQDVTQPVPGSMALRQYRPARLQYLGGLIPNISDGVECCPPDKISDLLQPFFENAIARRATAYIFGELHQGLNRIDQIHMNQGSVGKFEHENAVGQDGGVLLQFPDRHWEALFIAFQEQGSQTNADGQSIGPDLGSIVEPCKEPVCITALLYPDQNNPTLYPNGVPVCYLTISNTTKQEVVDLGGWQISFSESAEVYTIVNGQFLPGGERIRVPIPPGRFAGKSGAIFLRNRERETVDKVNFYQEWRARSGRLLYFGRTRGQTFS